METRPVTDWATDFEVMDPGYIESPYAVWDDLRERCPIAHTERRAPTWLPTRYDDVVALARDIEHFSSTKITVIPPTEPLITVSDAAAQFNAGIPPISADPPLHTWTRRLLLPWFSHRRVAEYEPMTRDLCRSLIGAFIETGEADAAADYAQQIPVRVIAWTLGVPHSMSDTFTGWVRDILEFGDDMPRRRTAVVNLGGYLLEVLAERREAPGNDLISELLHADVEGHDVGDGVVLGMAALTLIAGVDTTWSAIGSSLWHLATHPEDLARLLREPDMVPTAIEEFLRAYSPVTMARVVTDDVEFGGCPMKAEDRVLMNFPGANRDPEAFERADEVVIDRLDNRHIAFGVGIHRCAGSNLARMELRVAIEEWLANVGEFELRAEDPLTWAGGQVRGPRQLPVRFTPRSRR